MFPPASFFVAYASSAIFGSIFFPVASAGLAVAARRHVPGQDGGGGGRRREGERGEEEEALSSG